MQLFDLSSEFGIVRVTGANRADFLHRMSTGDLASIAPGEVRATVFTTPIGRMVDAASVYAFPDHLLMRVSTAGKDKLLRWLRKYVFYNDDVQFIDATAELAVAGVGGSDAGSWVAQQGATLDGTQYSSSGTGVIIHCCNIFGGPGCFLMGAPPELAALAPELEASPTTYNSVRVAAGIPRFGHEITEEFNPLEAGLWGAVSFSKGCYIGQEIIARMESRNQLAKKLMLVEIPNAPVGGTLLIDDAEVGRVTSAAQEFALAYVRTAAAQSDAAVNCGASHGRLVRVVHTAGV